MRVIIKKKYTVTFEAKKIGVTNSFNSKYLIFTKLLKTKLDMINAIGKNDKALKAIFVFPLIL